MKVHWDDLLFHQLILLATEKQSGVFVHLCMGGNRRHFTDIVMSVDPLRYLFEALPRAVSQPHRHGIVWSAVASRGNAPHRSLPQIFERNKGK